MKGRNCDAWKLIEHWVQYTILLPAPCLCYVPMEFSLDVHRAWSIGLTHSRSISYKLLRYQFKRRCISIDYFILTFRGNHCLPIFFIFLFIIISFTHQRHTHLFKVALWNPIISQRVGAVRIPWIRTSCLSLHHFVGQHLVLQCFLNFFNRFEFCKISLWDYYYYYYCTCRLDRGWHPHSD